ncbi:PREDICTED: alkane hydroxylase MAH1-like [Camelina sativa]|uniref:Alkane hydroxylase MAH1-like n=1 Tax=Camelina sativa TaxID=90675 RepID=A0ABM0TV42_CAMSA|nr:PREDICTED: alkane hydroxylase MAH1-like [Camelina sativa]
MASISLLDVSIAIICLVLFRCLFFKKRKDHAFRSWPVLGMIPGFLLELHRIYDFGVEIFETADLTFLFTGPWFTGMDMLFTVDPANIHYILSSNFSNYTKGADFKEVFDVFGEMIFSSDAELWKNQRKAAQYMLNHQGFQKLSMSTTRRKLYDGLVPLFDQCCEEEKVVDLQEVFKRFTFDTTFFLVTGCDPKSLSIEMPEVEYAKALDDLGEGIFYRHIKPKFLWKLQNLFGLGQEKRMTEADATFDRVSAKYISAKREEIRSKGIDHHQSDGESEDLLSSHIKLDTTKYELLKPSEDKFLRDTILAFNLAGRDTMASALSWFLWLLSQNPQVVTKIRKEIIDKSISKTGSNVLENLDKLVYLHAALYESMRLYPPVVFQRKSPIKADLLPSGHKVDANSVIIIYLYGLGRMTAVWGEDATEFKPERWISGTGGLRHSPSFKFLSFNAGPRTCPGKQLAMTLMKTVVVEILQNYDIKVIKGQKIEPESGLMLHMKHGLRVTITKRCSA